MTFSRQEKIAFVNQSPTSVALHDKDQWLSIFSHHAVIEDPVGTSPHRRSDIDNKTGKDALSRFYDTFIAPNTIRFDVKRDIVCDNVVVRDLTVSIDMERVSISVPMHLLYELVIESGNLKIARLAAHWELFPMMQSLLANGRAALSVMVSLSRNMLKNQGLLGMIGFASGVNVFASRQKQKVTQLLSAMGRTDEKAINLLVRDASAFKSPQEASALKQEALPLPLGINFEVGKLLAAGRFVSASLAGRLKNTETTIQGIAIFEFDRFGHQIVGVNFYQDTTGNDLIYGATSKASCEVENVPCS